MVTAQTSLFTDRGATFSPCRRYRYRLWREWGDTSKRLLTICLNPSSADEQIDDPTIRKCVGFARRWGFGAYDMVNAFAWRSTYPHGLLGVDDPIGPDNDEAISTACRSASRVVIAIGRHDDIKSILADRVKRVIQIATTFSACEVGHFGLDLNFDGSTKHPLYLPYTSEFRKWEAAC